MKRFVITLLAFTMLAAQTAPAPAAVGAPAYLSAPLGINHVPPLRGSVRARITLKNGDEATAYANGFEALTDKHGKLLRQAMVPMGFAQDTSGQTTVTPAQLLEPLLLPKPTAPFAPDQIVVVFQPGAAPVRDDLRVATNVRGQHPQYTPSSAVNAVFSKMGVDRYERIARTIDRGVISSMHTVAADRLGRHGLLDVSNAYVVHFTHGSVANAVDTLRDLPGIAYVTRNWYVSTIHPRAHLLSHKAQRAMNERALRIASAARAFSASAPHDIPDNYAVASSMQSLLNYPSVNAVTAYDLIEQNFNQLPGSGELIANISIGDIDNAQNSKDPCYSFAATTGSTTHLIGGQQYIDWPSMPLIPAYVVDSNGNASGQAEVCGIDPFLGEIGLDFSMMAPLPHQLQRGGEVGDGATDLLGIAPGAKYELFVPQDQVATMSDIIQTFLAAATSSRRPDVITASIGFGEDTVGFPGRYFEDDPLNAATIASIVQGREIVVCISANDGTRTFTTAAIGPAGGSAPTLLVPNGSPTTDLNDIDYTTLPSHDYDSGAIDVGGSTLDDLFAAPMGDPAFATDRNQLAWPETRWTGSANFSSGFGTRVNLSAPSDNVISLQHNYDGSSFYDYDNVSPALEGGTSASAPEVAAAAAVLLQVGRLTGHPFTSPQAVRDYLVSTARSIPNVPQADEKVWVGPQLDLGHAVAALLERAGRNSKLTVPRVAIAQRQVLDGYYGGTFQTDTEPQNIDLRGPYDSEDGFATPSGRNQIAPITIAPDWEGATPSTQYRLTIAGKAAKVLARTAWVRLFPEEILRAAGLPLVAESSRTVQLTYTARNGAFSASTSFSLTFSGAAALHNGDLAPQVAPVVTGDTISVSYDLSHLTGVTNPTLIVSEPGRQIPTFLPDPSLDLFHPAYAVPLTQTRGTVQIPVNKLQGGGVYGITVQYKNYPGTTIPDYTGFAFTRVVSGSSVRANAVMLSATGFQPTHMLLYLPYKGSYRVSWDVSNVPGANGALLEVGPAAPSVWGQYNTFDNPNGTVADDNGVDSGSVYRKVLSGASGSIELSGGATLTTALYNQLRVIPLKGTVAAGEASDPSFIGTDGLVAPDDTTPLTFGLGNGGWGSFMTATDSELTNYPYFEVTSNDLYPIDQTKERFASNLDPSPAPGLQLSYPLGPVSASNKQILYRVDLVELSAEGLTGCTASPDPRWDPIQFGSLSLSPGALPTSWTTASSGTTLCNVASDRKSDALLLMLWNNNKISFVPTTLSAVSLATQYDVTNVFQLSNPYWAGSAIQLDPNLNEGMVESGLIALAGQDPCGNSTSSHQLSLVSLSSGQVTTFAGAGHGWPQVGDYDSTTHVLADSDECGNLNLYNIAKRTATSISLPIGEPPQFIVADSTHNIVLVGDAIEPNYTSNNNAGSVIYEYSESGHAIKTLHGFNFYSPYTALPNAQINETSRVGWAPNVQGYIQPFTY